ncbi:hypothetical protein V2A60_001250 [Cordyceps javanica]
MTKDASDSAVDYANFSNRVEFEIRQRFLPLCSEDEKQDVERYLIPLAKFVASTVAPSRHNLVKGTVPDECPEQLRWAVACFVFGTDKIKASRKFGDYVRENEGLLEKFQLHKGPCVPMPKQPTRPGRSGEKRKASETQTGDGDDDDDGRRMKTKILPTQTNSSTGGAAIDGSETDPGGGNNANNYRNETDQSNREADMSDDDTDIHNREASIINRTSFMESRESELNDRDTALQREANLRDYEDSINNREAVLANRKVALKIRQNEMMDYETALDRRESDLKKSEAELDDCEAALRSREATLTSSEIDLTNREISIKSRETSLITLEADLDSREALLDSRESELKDREASLRTRQSQPGSELKQENDHDESGTQAQSGLEFDRDGVECYQKCYNRAILDINALRVVVDTAVGSVPDERHRNDLMEEFKEAADRLTAATNSGWKLFRHLSRK